MDLFSSNFRLAGRVGYTGGGAGNKYQGATFLALVGSKPPKSLDDFHGKTFAGVDAFLLCPLNIGKATAPYTYLRSANGKDVNAIKAANKDGLPLMAWADPNNTSVRFWSWAKVGYNRGARNEKLTWEYAGGDTFTLWIEPKDFEEAATTGEDKGLGVYLDGKLPVPEIKDMSLAIVCFMTKSTNAFTNTKKTCFAFKGFGGCTRTLASYLPMLLNSKSIPRSFSDATQKAEKTIRDAKVSVLYVLCVCACVCVSLNQIVFYAGGMGTPLVHDCSQGWGFLSMPGQDSDVSGDKHQWPIYLCL